MTKTLVEQYVQDPIHMRLFQQERAIYEATELIESVMAENRISRSQLAAKLGQSKSWVTQLLDGEKNKTIRTVADVFAVLGREYCSFQRPIQVGKPDGSRVASSVSVADKKTSPGLELYHICDYQATTTTGSQGVTQEAGVPKRAVN